MIKEVFSLDYSKKHIKLLFSFVDYLFQLPKNMEIDFKKEITTYVKGTKMAYVTSFERIGREEGIKEGVSIGKLSLLFTLLESKFGNVNDKITGHLKNASPKELDAIARKVLTANNLDELIKVEN